MQLRTEIVSLQLKVPFKVSYGASTERRNVLLYLEHDGQTGIGEAAIVPYYGISAEAVQTALEAPSLIETLAAQPFDLATALGVLADIDLMPARAALDMALHDLWGQHQGQPLHKLWGLDANQTPLNSYTIGMVDDMVAYREQLAAAAEYPIIKLKLGSGNIDADAERVRIARAVLTECDLCVDANGGWSVDETLNILPVLIDCGSLFIEQPLAKDNLAGWQTLRKKLPADPPPLIADESVQGLASIEPLIGLADGINIKLAKCGGLNAARQMIARAHEAGLRVMLGCMVESSVAITAAAQLAPAADYLDLDGHLLITNDPYRGAMMTEGAVILPSGGGLGLAPSA